MAVKLTQESLETKGSEDRSAHVGFYLIDKGLPELERAAGMSLSLMESLGRTIHQFPLLCYLGAITLALHSSPLQYLGQAYELGSGGWMLVLASIFLVIC